MLEELRIVSLGVIDEATLALGAGFTVVTGETGAGKTMVVTALELLLGARADVGLVRHDAERSRVEGRVLVDPDGPVASRAAELGAVLDDDTLIVSRLVSSSGRSRATAGGAAIPAATLASMSADLVVVHGQSDQQLLLTPFAQRQCLDRFGGEAVSSVLSVHRDLFDTLQRVAAELDEVTTKARERAREADVLRLGLAEIEAADPRPGEDRGLLAEEGRLAYADSLRRSAEEARAALSGAEDMSLGADAIGLVATARKSLEAERDHDPRLATLADELASASYALADVAADISSYAESVDTDPARLVGVQERRAVLSGLTRKYGETVDEVLTWSQQAALRLAELTDDGARIESLSDQCRKLRNDLDQSATQLTAARALAASGLARRVNVELAELAMGQTQFSVSVTDAARPGRDGRDEVGFRLASHDGAEPRPLQRGASGGELSRVMLALEVCLAGSDPVPTMVFDEVDAGVGGKAAVEVGRRLARLARNTQVIVVTHLPQVAAFADHHYAVVKSENGSVTTSGVTELDETARRSELSRMLAGLEDSSAALAHADELLALGRSEQTPRAAGS